MRAHSALALALFGLCSCVGAANVELRVDCAQLLNGELRPLHGVNGGPLNCGDTVDVSAYHREIGIPFTRLHDCHWPNPDVVDIHVIFPNFKADPRLPESYDFRRTDGYIQAIVNVGSKIVYRLGESIEHSKKRYYVHPPADYDTWAAVCIGIIRHYNEGWANGFKFNIQHWEIWNEPENRPAMWSGTDDDYFRLYMKSAKAIKAAFPDLQVGGPAVGYSGKMEGGKFQPSAFVKTFLERCKSEAAPLDFFSWHMYTAEPHDIPERARGIRGMLDQYGFTKTASHLNEWNYLPGNNWSPMLASGLVRQKFFEEIGSATSAAFTISALLYMQDSPLDVANYYSAEAQGFGMFNEYGVPKKSFYAFKAFKMVLDTPLRSPVQGAEKSGLAVYAGLSRDKQLAQVLIGNMKPTDGIFSLDMSNVPWEGETFYEIYTIDATRDLTSIRSGRLAAKEFRLTPGMSVPPVCLIRLRPAKPGE